jgi:hypothetical protein
MVEKRDHFLEARNQPSNDEGDIKEPTIHRYRKYIFPLLLVKLFTAKRFCRNHLISKNIAK